MKSPRYWRNRRGDNYHYYQDDKYGYGYVIAREGRVYHATGKLKSATFRSLREAKAFVEESWRGK